MINFGQNSVEANKRFRNAVNKERARRLLSGTDVNIQNYGWVSLQGRPEDQSTLAGLAQNAGYMIQGGVTDSMPFMDRANFLHTLTPAQIIQVFQLGSQFVSSVYKSSFSIKNQTDIFIDPTNDTLWPTPGQRND